MIEFDIRGDGTIVSMSRREFYQLLISLIGSYVNLAVQYIRLHMVGLAEFDTEYLKNNLTMIQHQLNVVRNIITDQEIEEGLNTLYSCLLKVEEHDNLIIRAYADQYGVQNRNNTIDRKKLKKFVKQSRSLGSPLPEVVIELSKESDVLITMVQNLESQLPRRIEQLYNLENS